MTLGRHTELAIVKMQERGARYSDLAMEHREDPYIGKSVITFCQKEAAFEYATARKLMNIEPEGTENV